MAHQAQILFCRMVKKIYPKYFQNSSVIDVGSLDINGNNQYLFENCSYLGVDIVKGKNVNLVLPIHLLEYPLKFDVVISTEMLEHDRFWMESLRKMYDLLREDGLMVITCAAPGRPEHGTSKHLPESSPKTNDYYRNISEQDFSNILPPSKFKEYNLRIQKDDLQFYGIK